MAKTKKTSQRISSKAARIGRMDNEQMSIKANGVDRLAFFADIRSICMSALSQDPTKGDPAKED